MARGQRLSLRRTRTAPHGHRPARGARPVQARRPHRRLPVSEHPLFRDHGNPQTGYIQPQAILEALRDEYFQQPWRTDEQAQAEQAEAEADVEAAAHADILDAAREHGLERDEAFIERTLLLYAEGLSPEATVQGAFRNSLRSSIRVRQPIVIAGSTSAANRSGRPHWQRRTASKANYQRTLEV